MKLEEIRRLPDIIPIEESMKLFKKALSSFHEKEINKQQFLEILLELTERQVKTYEILENDLRNEVDRCIVSIWNTDSYNDVDAILSIVVNLGLVKTYDLVKESLNGQEDIREDIYEEIKECVDENGDDVSNPYRFLEYNN
ncbi:MAG: hypothetical protein U0K68_01945 [Agathobacter sp.]|nr:hypothetical protein [Agathobacter sp.]